MLRVNYYILCHLFHRQSVLPVQQGFTVQAQYILTQNRGREHTCQPLVWRDTTAPQVVHIGHCTICLYWNKCHAYHSGEEIAENDTRLYGICVWFFFCSLGTRSGVEYPCPAGTFSGQTSTSNKRGCVPCRPGKYCSSAGLAMPTGHFSPGVVASL